MYRTRGRKIIRDILARKGRTFLVSTAIFIGVAGTIALFSLSDILVKQLREDIKEDELTMITSFLSPKPGEEIGDEAYLESLQTVNGITEVMAGVQGAGFFKLKADADDYEDGLLFAFSTPYEAGLPIEPMRLIDGEYPQAAGEIVIEQRLADEYNIGVGDSLYFRVLSPSADPQLNGRIGTVEPRTISGVVFHPYSDTPNATIFTTLEDANYLAGISGYNFYIARFTDFKTAEAEMDNFSQVIVDETPYIPVFTFAEDPANSPLIQGAKTLGQTMGSLAFIALVVSGFLVINVVTSIVVEQKRQIGVMKSMGASYFDNVLIYTGIAFLYGLIGVIPGLIVGIPAGNAAAHALAPGLNTVLDGFQTSSSAIMRGVMVGLLVPVLAAIVPVMSGVRVKILDAMTDLGISAVTTNRRFKLIERGNILMSLWLLITLPFRLWWRLTLFLMIELPLRIFLLMPLPINLKQAFRNLLAKQTRIAFTMIALAVAAGAFMGIFSVFNTISAGLNTFFDLFNAQVIFLPTESVEGDRIYTIIEENFQVDDATIAADLDTWLAENVSAEEATALREPLMDARKGGFSKNEVLQVLLSNTVGIPDGANAEELSNALLANAEIPGQDVTSGINTTLTPEMTERLPVLVAAVTPLHDLLRRNDNVAFVEPGFQAQVEFVGYEPIVAAGGPPAIFGYGYAVESETPAFNFDISEGEMLTPETAENGIIFSSTLAENMKVGVGDTVTIRVPGNTADLVIVGITEYPIEQIFMDWRTIAKISGYVAGAPKPNEYTATIQLNDQEATAVGVDAAMFSNPALEQLFVEGEAFTAENPGVIVTEPFAEAQDYNVGDTVTVAANGTTAEYPITGIVNLPPEAAGQMGITDNTVVMEFASLVALTGASGEGEPVAQAYFITTTDADPDLEALNDEIDNINEVFLDRGVPSQFLNVLDFIEQFSNAISQIQLIFSAVAGLIALVGALGLLTTLSMSVFERQKEIGVMRSIGASSSTVAIQFLTEGLVVGIIAWLIGLPIAFFLQVMLFAATGLDDTFPIEIQPNSIALGFAGVMFFTILASLWPSLAAARRTVSDILRYQ